MAAKVRMIPISILYCYRGRGNIAYDIFITKTQKLGRIDRG